ncbi:MAG: hypothetical protein HY702_06680 [Gemmatimonadetes bacterium]|nr:hypothetical protein [Gemmatimonadota bacterium]
MKRSLLAAAILALSLAVAERAPAQGIELSFRGADVYAGAVFPETAQRGASFGGVAWLGRVFHPRVQWGLGLRFASADRTDARLSVRDIAFYLDLALPLLSSGWLQPYVGVTGSLDNVSATPEDEASEIDRFRAEGIDGYKLGAGAFAGFGFPITGTGAVGFLVEYRFVVVPKVTYQEVRAGIRLSTGER